MAATLLEKIDDEFLSCMICMDRFKNPKTLSCLHTFCSDCIGEHYRKNRRRVGVLTCPACRLDIQLHADSVESLPSNYFVAGLCEVFQAREKNRDGRHDMVCCGCDEVIMDNSSFCMNCRDFLCGICAVHHNRTKQTKTHRVVRGTDMDCIENLVDMRSQSSTTCKQHENESLKLYCENCHVPVCVVCSVTSHRGHNFNDADDSVEKIRQAISRMLSPAEQKVSEYQYVLDGAISAEELLVTSHNETKRTIDEATDKMIADVAVALRQQAENLKSEADEFFKARQREIKDYKEKVQHEMEGARNACDYSRKMVRFSRVAELLFANQNLKRKLNDVNSAYVEPFGKTAKIQYVRSASSPSFPKRGDVGTVSLVQMETTKKPSPPRRKSQQTFQNTGINHDFGMAPPIPTVQVGKRVRRGPDWVWGAQDGGPGSTGTIVSVLGGGWVTVRWDYGKTDKYRMGSGNQFDVQLA